MRWQRRQRLGGRHLSGSGALLLGGLLWKRLHLGRHGGVVVVIVVEGSVVGGGVGDGIGVVVVDALFIAGDFLV